MLFLLGAEPALSQGLFPSTPSKEYIRINGQIVATENWVGLSSIAVGYDGSLWALTAAGMIYQYVPNQGWNQIPGSLTQLAVGNSSSVWGLNSGGYVYHYVNGTFQNVPGNLVQMAVGSDGDMWGINSATSIYHFNGSGWTQIPGSLLQIAAGNAGAVYGVNGPGNVYQFNTSTQTFQQFTNLTLAKVSVGSDGDLWGLNSAGTCFHWYLGGWQQQAGTYSQISVGSRYNIWALNGSGTVYFYLVPYPPGHFFTAVGSGFSFVGAPTGVSQSPTTYTAFLVGGSMIYQYTSSGLNPLPEMMAWFRDVLDRFRLFQIAG